MAAVDRSKYMSVEEVRQLRTVTEARAIVDLRHGRKMGVLAWAVLDTALQTGLRVSEIAALTVGDVDLKRGALRVRRRKRKKPKAETVAVSRQLLGHLRDFIQWKGHVGQDTSPKAALFVGSRGPLTAPGLSQLWKATVRRAGIPKEITIHGARHTLAVHLLRKTGNLRMVQKQLGHASPAVTANMYADVSFEDMQNGLAGLYETEATTG